MAMLPLIEERRETNGRPLNYNLQQHLESSAFMPLQPLPSASTSLGGQLRPQPIAYAPTEDAQYRTPLGPEPEVHRHIQS